MSSRLTARDIQKPLHQIDFDGVPLWPDHLIAEAFLRIRDEQWLDSLEQANFKRRIPWLYADNGCYLRAALIRRKFAEWNYPSIKKIFCFGSMVIKSPWFVDGKMTYKDHVAVLVRDSKGCMVIDPPVHFAKPLRLEEWIEAIHAEGLSSDAKFSVCNALTVGSNSYFDEEDPACETGMRAGEMKSMDFFAAEFLPKEWNRVVELGLSPTDVLGGQPPWFVNR